MIRRRCFQGLFAVYAFVASHVYTFFGRRAVKMYCNLCLWVESPPPPLLQCKKKLNVYFSFITIKIYKPFIICQKKTIDKILSDKSIKIQYSFISNHNWLYIFEWRRPQSFKKKDDLLDEVQYNRTTAPPAVRL